MARDSDELMHEENAPEGGKRRSPVLVFVVLIVIVVLLWNVIGDFFGHDDAKDQSAAKQRSSDDTTTYNQRRAQQREDQDKQTSSAVDKTFSIDDRTDESAVVAVDRRVSATNDRLDTLANSVDASKESQKRQFKKLQNRIDEELNKLTQSVQNQSNSKILDERDRAMSGDSKGASSAQGLPRLGDQGSGASGASQDSKGSGSSGHNATPHDDFPYRTLGSTNSQAGSGSGMGLFGGSSGSSNGATARTVAAHGQQPPASPADDRDNGQSKQPRPLNKTDGSSGGDGSKNDSKYDPLTVPGNSWVHVTDLHGVACPVGGNQSSGKGSGTLLEQVPITLPVEGNFHGPNGTTYRLGSPNISGTCIGQETERPTAIIKVERLSYVGPDGKPQFIPINGYLIDRRDNQFGIAGYLDQARGSEIAKAAAAAGLSAAGDIFSDSQFDTTFFGGGGANTGAASSIQGKDVPAAVAGKSFSATANKIAEAYQQAADRVVPVVRIQAGLPITMITTTPFQYLKADSNSEVSNVQ